MTRWRWVRLLWRNRRWVLRAVLDDVEFAAQMAEYEQRPTARGVPAWLKPHQRLLWGWCFWRVVRGCWLTNHANAPWHRGMLFGEEAKG